MDDIPRIGDSRETYSRLDGDGRMIVRYLESEGRYHCTVLDDGLSLLSSFPINTAPEDGVVYATVSALRRMGNEGNVEVFAFRDDMEPVGESIRFNVDTDLLDSLSRVRTDALEKLVDDEALDPGLRAAIRMTLSERGSDV